jgi:hypothetical protein
VYPGDTVPWNISLNVLVEEPTVPNFGHISIDCLASLPNITLSQEAHRDSSGFAKPHQIPQVPKGRRWGPTPNPMKGAAESGLVGPKGCCSPVVISTDVSLSTNRPPGPIISSSQWSLPLEYQSAK